MIALFIYFVSAGVRTAEKPLLPPRLLHEVVLQGQTAATQHLAGRHGMAHQLVLFKGQEGGFSVRRRKPTRSGKRFRFGGRNRPAATREDSLATKVENPSIIRRFPVLKQLQTVLEASWTLQIFFLEF